MYTLVTVVERDITTQVFKDNQVRKAMEQVRDTLFDDISHKYLGKTGYTGTDAELDELISATVENEVSEEDIEVVRQLHGMIDAAITGMDVPYGEYNKTIGAGIYNIERISDELPLGLRITAYDGGYFDLEAWSNCNDDYAYDARLCYADPNNLPEY